MITAQSLFLNELRHTGTFFITRDYLKCIWGLHTKKVHTWLEFGKRVLSWNNTKDRGHFIGLYRWSGFGVELAHVHTIVVITFCWTCNILFKNTYLENTTLKSFGIPVSIFFILPIYKNMNLYEIHTNTHTYTFLHEVLRHIPLWPLLTNTHTDTFLPGL